MTDPSGVPPWRELLVRWVSALAFALNGLGALLGISMTSPQRRARLAVGGLVAACIYAAALVRSLPLAVRSWLLVAGFLTVSMTGFLSVGFLGAPAGAAILAILVAGILLGPRAQAAVILATAVGIVAIAFAMTSGAVPPPTAADVAMTSFRAWMRSAGIALFLGALAGSIVTWVVARIEAALASERVEASRRERAEVARTEAEQLAIDAQKLELVGRLAAGLAHDFNNHLTVIGLSSVQLGREGLSAEERRAASHAIAGAVRSAGDLARQLMVLGRGAPRTVEHLALRDVVDAFIASIERALPSDVVLRVEHQGEPSVDADGSQLRQVLLNFVVNARDAMPEGGRIVVRTRSVTLEAPVASARGAIAPGSWSVLEVEDTGTGIEEATRQRLFEPFFTTKPIDRGTGLGLATVSLIASAAGGHVTLDSEVGKGTTASLWLPAKDGRPETPARVATPPPAAARRLVGRAVLLVEDEPLVLRAAVLVLEEAGCRVVAASDGTEALDRMTDGCDVDLLCTDVVMPGAPVRDVIARFRELHPDKPVLACSGYVGEDLVRRGVEEGRVRLLEKPYTPDDLLAAIAAALSPGAATTAEPGERVA
jgi:signal transduction histidine kinase/ActR/RegA family two-component response regulator